MFLRLHYVTASILKQHLLASKQPQNLILKSLILSGMNRWNHSAMTLSVILTTANLLTSNGKTSANLAEVLYSYGYSVVIDHSDHLESGFTSQTLFIFKNHRVKINIQFVIC
jgi:hypothetical protein